MKNHARRKLLLVVLAASLVLDPNALLARGRRGAHIVLSLKDSRQAAGELIAVRGESLLILDSAGMDRSFDIADVVKLRISKKAKTAPAAIIGGLTGGACGLAYSLVQGRDDQGIAQAYAIFYGPIGALLGAIIAGSLASTAGKEKVIELESMTESQVRQTLVRLRYAARIPR